MKSQHKLTLIFLLSAFFISLLKFNNAIDDFAPYNIAVINEITQRGYFLQDIEYLIPGYYSYGTIISLICDFPVKELLFIPIQLVPLMLIFFLVIYNISENYIFSSLITFIELIMSSTGTAKVFFWPHGLGYILFFTVIFLTLKFISSNKLNSAEFNLLLIIVGSSLVFISYDLFVMCLILLITFSLLFFFLRYRNINHVKNNEFDYSSKFIKLSVILVVVELGLSRFFYQSLSFILNTNYVELSGLEKLIYEYFSFQHINTPLKDVLLSFPKIITVLSIIKYGLLIISIALFLKIIYNKISKKDFINKQDLLIISILFTFGLYSVLRVYIGQSIISYFYYPGILCTIWLYRYSTKFKNWAFFVILTMFFIVPASYYVLSSNDLINKDENKFDYLDTPSKWYLEYGTNPLVNSDVLTKGFFLLNLEKNALKNKSYILPSVLQSNSFQTFTTVEVMFLLNKPNYIVKDEDFIINYNLNYMSLQNWIMIKSWRQSKDKIDGNLKINKIYDINAVSIYSTS